MTAWELAALQARNMRAPTPAKVRNWARWARLAVAADGRKKEAAKR